MVHLYVEIAKNISLFWLNHIFKVSRTLVLQGGSHIIPTVIGVVSGNRISKKMFSITFGKSLSARN